MTIETGIRGYHVVLCMLGRLGTTIICVATTFQGVPTLGVHGRGGGRDLYSMCNKTTKLYLLTSKVKIQVFQLLLKMIDKLML